MPALPPPSPKRILLIRLSAFGDIVIATGLLHSLRRAHPEAEIDWLVQPEFAALLSTQPAIAQVQIWPRKQWGALWRGFKWLALWRAIGGFRSALRARDYDWVVDAQGLAKSRVLAVLAGGRFRIGYASKEPLGSWMHRRVSRYPEAHPTRAEIGSEHQPMADALGLGALTAPALVAEAAAPDDNLVILAPFTTRPQKHWPESYWQSLIGTLLKRGLRLRLMGGPGDQASAVRLLSGMTAGAVDNQVGRTSLVEAARQIAAASAVIGVDTGLTHLAASLGRPVVAIFGSTLPYFRGHPDLHAPLSVISLRLPCGPCARQPTCGGSWDCLTQIPPAKVDAALNAVLKDSAPL